MAACTPSSAREVLGVQPSATAAEIRTAYLSLEKKWHPDRHADQTPTSIQRCTEMFKFIRHAYGVLNQQAVETHNDGRAEPSADDISEALRDLFLKSIRKTRSANRNVIHASRDLAAPISGFDRFTNVAGDGNCALYVLCIAMQGREARERLWPDDYSLAPFIHNCDAVWWTRAGENYRAGSNEGPCIIAAAAVCRSRIDERSESVLYKLRFGQSLEADDLGELATNILGCRIEYEHTISLRTYTAIRLRIAGGQKKKE